MIDDIRTARDEALAEIAAAGSLDDLARVGTTTLGKRSPLAILKTELGAVASVDERRAAGRELNEAMQVLGGPSTPGGPSWPTPPAPCASRTSDST